MLIGVGLTFFVLPDKILRRPGLRFSPRGVPYDIQYRSLLLARQTVDGVGGFFAVGEVK